ncbi:uncharacterized protein LOC115774866 [Archocentrus centrarchus]|uniref:uncharacterized protein LOC115774866 n=1 Tax=Archocentrus centrarchus TaxID=63155 RepID=UPI0011E9C807|nr:uncharacterized protein LOC115774866 [Archocentrus centrarchus]XP_030578191.1 uncharacterized protein LOC115774866 [Archocentrus centrarchus]XP_030578192.1 uncharacterized protein LOC115774866 [Archocentrus centrarchus]
MTKTLIKVQLGAKKKYVKLEDVCFSDFVSAVQEKFLIPQDTILKVTDDHSVEVDDDVFPELAAREICFVIYTDDELPLAESSSNSADCSDKTEYGTLDLSVVQQGGEIPSSPSLTDTASVSSSLSSDTSDLGCKRSESLDSNYARNTVQQILTSKPAGMTVIKEYEETGSLKDSTRRLMVNIIVAHMREKEGSRVSKATKEFHALGIVSRFPALKDPYSNKGYEHFYDIQSNKGFLEWRLKTVQRQSRTASSSLKKVVLKGGPTSLRPTVVTTGDQQTGDDCMEAISFLNHTTDRDLVFHKMRDTFQYRQQILHNPQHSADVLQIFPRFLDIRLILQDFSLMFGEETASRFLRKWNTSFKDKVTQEAKNLKETSLLKRHLRSALNEGSDTTDDPGTSNVVEQSIVLDCLFVQAPKKTHHFLAK